jgi:hypothetical protein
MAKAERKKFIAWQNFFLPNHMYDPFIFANNSFFPVALTE